MIGQWRAKVGLKRLERELQVERETGRKEERWVEEEASTDQNCVARRNSK